MAKKPAGGAKTSAPEETRSSDSTSSAGGAIRPGPVELSTASGELASGAATGPRPGEVVQPSTTGATARGARRVPRSLDFLTPKHPLDRHTLLASRAHAAAHFHLELAEAKTQLGVLKAAPRFGASRLAIEKGRLLFL